MILYHGSTKKRCESIIRLGQHEPGHKRGPNDDSVLWASDSLDMAKSYGKSVIEIEVDENDDRIVGYPVFPCNYDYYEEWMEDANEYCIPPEVTFKARMLIQN